MPQSDFEVNVLKNFWLFQTSANGLSPERKAVFWLWNGFVMLMAGVCLGVLSLIYAYGDYADILMKSYFQIPLIAALNILPVVLLLLLVYALVGCPWISFLCTGVVVWGFSLGNYYKLRFRDDPLMFEDMRNIREAGSIVLTEGYDMTPDLRVWFGLACLVLGTLFLRFLVRGRLNRKARISMLLASVLLWIPMWNTCTDSVTYLMKTSNTAYINQWASTQVYISKGFVYPFLYSTTTAGLAAPEGYDKEETAALLEAYTDADIPDAQKVDLIVLQLEAFSDLSRITNVEGIDWEKAYGIYHGIEAESLSGDLITNVFAAGTVDTERAVLTGFAHYRESRANINSHVWYLRDQGYTVEGSHPSSGWFYNRKNINRHMGISTNYFLENWYERFYPNGAVAAMDDVLFPELYALYRTHRDQSDAPYFSFNVTYQGHGPYSTQRLFNTQEFTDGRYSEAAVNIVDNYLTSLADTAVQLRAMLDQFSTEERPVVILGYGDHKPWLGDGNSVYYELGINIDVSSEEGFRNYYGTRYFIWANDAAQKLLNMELSGEGPDVSSCFLMNLLFDRLGWTGDAWMQATTEIWRTLPVVTSIGRYEQTDGVLTVQPDAAGQAALDTYWDLEYYYRTHFRY